MATKLQISITNEEENLLAQKAALLGYDVTKYVKFLLSREAYEEAKRKEKLEKLLGEAMKKRAKGKTTIMSSGKDIDKWINSL